MAAKRLPFRRTRIAVLVLLTGGTLFSTCTTRFKESAVNGATNFLFTLLDPGTIAGLLIPSGSSPTNGV